MKAFLAGICLFFATLVSCQQKGEGFTSVSADEFATLIADPEIQRLDVRTVAEYSEEHIPGSININVLDEQFAVVADIRFMNSIRGSPAGNKQERKLRNRLFLVLILSIPDA